MKRCWFPALMFVVALLAAALSHAGEARVSWSAPTQRVDGTALTNLAGYRLLWGAAPRTYTSEVLVNNPATLTYTVTDLGPGTVYFAVTAFDATGLESAYSAEVSKEFVEAPVAPPVPPDAVVTGTTGSPQPVYVILQGGGNITLVPVGTVPAGTPCDGAQAVRDANGVTAFPVPESSVEWAGTARRSVVLAQCE